jgi:hypothetical protein
MSSPKKPKLSNLDDEELHDIIQNNPHKLHETGIKLNKVMREVDRDKSADDYKY